MIKMSYKNKLITIVIILYLIATTILINFLSTINNTDVGDISKKNFESKAIEREQYLYDFFKPYTSSIKSLQKDRNFISYLNGDLDESFIQNYFMSIKKSLPCLIQIRFIDNEANEVIKIAGNSINIFKDKAISKIIPKEQLQNKSNTDYIKKFMSLEADEMGLSKIDLNFENNKVVIPKQPTLRLAMAVYDDFNDKKGIVVLNICLRTLFNLVNKTTLYNVYLIDKEGRFLNHQNKDYGLLGSNMEYSIKEQFPNEWKNILSKDEYFGKSFFSHKLKRFDNEQNIKLLLELKFDKQINDSVTTERNLILYFILFIVVSLAIIIYFSNLPDKLKNEIEKNRLIDSSLRLPNRIALIEDLFNQKFDNSVIILISLNNLIKIKNSYSQRIADLLVKKASLYIRNYDKNNIQKVYRNNYHTFVLKHEIEDEQALKLFLIKFLNDIENRTFKLKKYSLDFSLEITAGVSDPENMNNNMEELREAENALENALEKDLHIDIFNATHTLNIDKQKKNIVLSKEIKKAIENDNVVLHYQAIYNNRTKEIQKYESLMRIQLEDKIIYPDEFLTLSKQIKKYTQLSKIVVNKSFDFFLEKDYEFSINISIIDILNKNFSEYLIRKIQEHNIGSKLVLEIVEQENVEDYDEFYSFLKTVKSLGCKIAVDDFGSGYSNFDYIIKMSEYIDYLKIDGSLIKNIANDEKSLLLIQSIIFLCDKLDIKTIAEYVENKEIHDLLTKLGIDFSQGYYIAKPSANLVKKIKSELK